MNLNTIRSQRHSIISRMISSLLIIQLVFPAFLVGNVQAEVIADPSVDVRFRPNIQIKNQVPVVNIVAPDNSGVSHNQYTAFSVDENGLVFNNSLISGNSRLAGSLVANPLLGGRSASTILNEITGISDSQLKGVMEVFGNKSNVIIANPNGITCDGCGFINTERLSLTTGRPFYQDENLGFSIDEGVVQIGSEGLNHRFKPASVDVLSRYITIGGEINIPGTLNVISGSFDFDYATSEVSPLSSSAASTASAPVLAIDASEFGAMQAGKINIIGTEAGLGVKADGYLFSHADDLFISSAGGASIRNADAFRAINIQTSDKVAINDDLIANESIRISSREVAAGSQSALMSQSVAVEAQNEVNLQGEIIALDFNVAGRDVLVESDVLAFDSLSIHSENRLYIQQSDLRSDDINISGNDLIVDAVLFNAGRLNAEYDTMNALHSEISVQSALKLDGTVTSIRNTDVSSGEVAVSSSDRFDSINSGFKVFSITEAEFGIFSVDSAAATFSLSSVESSGLNVNAAEFNITGSDILSGNVAIQAARLQADADSSLSSLGLIDVTAGDVRFDGRLLAEALVVDSDAFQSGGILQLENEFSVNSGLFVLDNAEVYAKKAYVNSVEQAVSNTRLLSEDLILSSGESLDISDSYIRSDSVVLQSDSLSIGTGVDLGAGVLLLESGALVNKGSIFALNTADVSSDRIENFGSIIGYSNAVLRVSGSFVNNNGAALLSDDMNLEVGKLVNAGDIVFSEASIRSAGDLVNTGSIVSEKATASTDISVNGAVLNAGTVSVKGTLTLQAADLLNDESGYLYSANVQSELTGAFENKGVVISERLKVDADSIHLSEDSSVAAADAIYFESRLLSNSGDIYVGALDGSERPEVASGAIHISGGEFKNKGSISSRGSVRIDAVSIGNYGTIDAFSDAVLSSSGVLDNFSDATIFADSLVINSSDIKNAGIVGFSDASISVNGMFDNSGYLFSESADGHSSIQVGGDFNNAGGFALSGDLDINVFDFDNAGEFYAADMDLNASGEVNNEGSIFSVTSRVSAQALINQQGSELAAQDHLSIDADSVENRGYIISERDIAVTFADNFLNKGSVISGSDTSIVGADGSSLDNESIVSSTGNMSISASAIRNLSGGSFLSGGDADFRFYNFDNIHSAILNSDGGASFEGLDPSSGEILNRGGLFSSSMQISLGRTLDNNGGHIATTTGDFVLSVGAGYSQADASSRASLTNNAGGIIVSKGNMDLTSVGDIHNYGGSTIYGFNDVEMNLVGGDFINGHLLPVNESGVNESSVGTLFAGKDFNISGGDIYNLGYQYAPVLFEAVANYSADDGNHRNKNGKRYYDYRHRIDYIYGEVDSESVRSLIKVGNNINAKDSALYNTHSDVVSLAGDIKLQDYIVDEEKVQLRVYRLGDWHSRTGSRRTIRGNYIRDIKNAIATDDQVFLNQLYADLKEENGKFYWYKPWRSGNEWVAAGSAKRLADIEQFNPNTVSVLSAANGKVFASGSVINSGAIVAKDLKVDDGESKLPSSGDEYAASDPNVVHVNDRLNNFENHGAGVFNLDTSGEPSAVISLLGFAFSHLDQKALEAASVSGDKTQEQQAAEAALLQQLGIIKDSSERNSEQYQNGVAVRGSSLFDLDPSILNRIIADTEYELQPDYIFDRLQDSQLPDVKPVFFLDPYQEAQAITKAALAQTGTAYFSPDWSTSAQQRQALYDNTLAYVEKYQAEGNVKLGQALTRQQIQQLEQPMIWYVSMNIGGTDQLVPTVYLPEATLEQITSPSVGTIVADTLDVKTGNFTNTGNIQIKNNASIYAESFRNQRNVMTFGDDTNYAALASAGGNISAGSLRVQSATDINNIGGSLASTGDMSLIAANDINLNAVELAQRTQNGRNITERSQFITSSVQAGGNASFVAGNNVNSQAASIMVDGDAVIDANNINLLGVTEREYEQKYSKKSGTFSSSRTTTQTEQLTFTGTELLAGGNLLLNARNNMTLQGAEVIAQGDATLNAENDILITAGINQDSYSKEKSGSGIATKTQHNQGYVKQEAVGSTIASGGNLHINSNGGDVAILASTVAAENNITMGDTNLLRDENGAPVLDANGQYVTADGNSIGNLTIGTVELKDEEWDVKKTSLKGPLKDLATAAMFVAGSMGVTSQLEALGVDTTLTVGSSQEQRIETTHHATSTVDAGGNLVVRVDDHLQVNGSQVNAGGSGYIETGSTTVTAVMDTTTTTESRSEQTVAATKPTIGQQEITIAGVTATDHTETTTTYQETAVAAGLNINGNLIMNSSGDIALLGSDVTVGGDASLTAQNITVAGVTENSSTTHTEKTEVTTTSVGIKNAYVDAVYAADAVVKAGEQVEAAERALRDAEQRVKDGTLAASAIDDYKINLAAATTQLTQATLNLAAAGATAAGSSGTGGFYASANAQTTTTERESASTSQNYVGSNINVGGNAAFNATDALSIIGSSVNVQEQLALNASNVTITAGTEESTSRSSEQTYSAGMSFSNSAGNSFSANASASSSDSDSYSKTHINSSINAGSLTSTSDQFTLQGGNVDIQNDIDITTGQLTIASLQDESRSRSSSEGYNISGSVGGNLPIDPSNVGGNQNTSSSDSKWVNNQTALIGGTSGNGSVNITADKTDITGATVASATRNEDGTLADNGNLTLITDELTITNLYDHNTSKSSGVNISAGVSSSGTTTVGLTNSGHNTEQTTYATLGGGTVQKKDGTAHDIADVNTDLNTTQEITLDQQTGGLDATVTVDHRVFTDKGQEQILRDFEDTENHFGNEILGGIVEGVKAGSVTAAVDAVGRKIDLRHGVADIQSDTTGNTEEKLNAIDGDAASKQEGIQELSDLLTSQAGVAGQEMLVYMNDDDAAAGMHHNAGNMSGVNASVTDMTDGAAIVQTAVHETTHHILNEKNDTYSAETKEYAATQDGDYAKKLWEQQNRRNGNTTGGTAQDIANWNANNSNSGLIAANNQRVAEVPKAEREELLPVLIIGGIKLAEVALTAYEAKQLKDAYDRGEVSNQELAEMAAMNAATSAAGLIPVPGSSVASKILAKGAERFRTHVDAPSATGSSAVSDVTQAFGEKPDSGSLSSGYTRNAEIGQHDAESLLSDGSCSGVFCNGQRVPDTGQQVDVELNYSRNKPYHDPQEFVDQAFDQGAGLSERSAVDSINTIDDYAKNGRSIEARTAITNYRDSNPDVDTRGKDILHKLDICAGGDPSCISRAGDSGVNRSIGSQNGRQSDIIRDQLENMGSDGKPTVRVNIENKAGN